MEELVVIHRRQPGDSLPHLGGYVLNLATSRRKIRISPNLEKREERKEMRYRVRLPTMVIASSFELGCRLLFDLPVNAANICYERRGNGRGTVHTGRHGFTYGILNPYAFLYISL